MKKALSMFLSFVLMLTMIPGAALAASAAYGSEVWLRDTQVHSAVTLSDNIYWSEYYSQLRHEYYFTYTPSYSITPAVAYGQSVCDRITTLRAAQDYETAGYRVVGAINGDYYDTGSGYPLGLLVSGGKILSGSGNYYAVGFKSDGSAVVGAPALTITAQSGASSHQLVAINKPRVENGGVALLTYDFRTDHTTGTTTQGVNVLCDVIWGHASLNGQMTLRVRQVTEDLLPVTMNPDQVVLTAASTGSAAGLNFLRSLMPGTQVSVSFASADPSWNGVAEAVGALHLLVKDGVVQTGFEAGYAPRTAIGVKANGQVVLYTVDGRQTGYSMGASLKVLAERMAELGCVNAVCLDGGGSTTAVTTMPYSTAAEVINSPSDGSVRKVSNSLLLLAPAYSSGMTGGIYMRVEDPVVLAGKTTQVYANLVDSNYAPVQGAVTVSASAGQVVNGEFIAPERGGWVTITASVAGRTTTTDVLVVDTPDEMTVLWDGSKVDTVTMFPGDKAKLSTSVAYRHLPLNADASDFLWSVDPALGTIENGVLTTNYSEGSGAVTVTMGAKSVVIPLVLDADSPFVDTEGHWGSAFMAKLYHKGVLTGEIKGDLLYANPDKGVTRAEFAVLLSRYMGLNTEDYAAIEVPFTDMDKVGDWAKNAVKAMYALGIVNGVGQNDGTQKFDPQGALNRAQAVTMLGRANLAAAQYADLSLFSDSGKIPGYALEHFQTMVGLGVIGGSNGKLDPNGTMTRAAICKVLTLIP